MDKKLNKQVAFSAQLGIFSDMILSNREDGENIFCVWKKIDSVVADGVVKPLPKPLESS